MDLNNTSSKTLVIPVNIPNKKHKIFLGYEFKNINKFIKNISKKILVITQKKIFDNFKNKIQKIFSTFEAYYFFIPEGEEVKNLETVKKIYKKCAELKLDRTSAIVVLGGGVVGDVGGFIASTYLRGLPLISIPTTLLAMVDSSIGGKVGVDLPFGKNLIGTFYQPKLIMCDLEFLSKLPPAEFSNGVSEIIKYAVIAKPEIFTLLKEYKKKQELKILKKTIFLSCKVKADVVSKDEFETKGIREILNFGHTIAHAIETVSGYKYPHGKAVACGMIVETLISKNLKILKDENLINDLKEILSMYNLPIKLPLFIKKNNLFDKLIDAISYDKKIRFGKLRIILPQSSGNVKIIKGVSEQIIKKSLFEAIVL